MSRFVHSFSHLRPSFEMNQVDGLQWLARAHQIPIERVERVACTSQIETRGYSIPEILTDADTIAKRGFGERNRLFEKVAYSIFEQFYEKAEEPDEMIHVTCTGYISPSPGQRVIAQKGWNSAILHIYHMGCFGAVPAMRIANQLRGSTDIVHTEICSLHFHPGLSDDEQLVAQSLFADGFIKYRVDDQKQGFRILKVEEHILPNTADQMSWGCEDWGLRMTLSKSVPYHLQKVIRSFVERFGTADYFAIHPGGPKILEGIQRQLQLEDEQIWHSKEVLRRFGNMSSATVPHILEMMERDLQKGDRVLGLAFGPGLMIVGILLEKT